MDFTRALIVDNSLSIGRANNACTTGQPCRKHQRLKRRDER